MYKHESTNRYASKTCEGVTLILRKMTEGRRIELRKKLKATNSRMRELLREQGVLLNKAATDQDNNRIMDIQDELDGLMIEVVNPETIKWGVKAIEGLEVEGETLTVEQWDKWPSKLFKEAVSAVNEESRLDEGEVVASVSPTTSGEPGAETPELSNALTA